MATTDLKKWTQDALDNLDGADIKVPPNLLRALMAKSVIDNWPRYEVAHDEQGNAVMLRFGSSAAANKALEMLAKDAGLLDDHLDVSGRIDIVINGVSIDDLT